MNNRIDPAHIDEFQKFLEQEDSSLLQNADQW